MTAANGEDIVVVRSVRDTNGDVVSFTEHTLRGCVVAPSSSTEDVATGDRVTARWDVYVLAGADVTASDRLRRPTDPAPAQGAPFKARAPWQVYGDPAPWSSPFSQWTPGMVVTIEKVTG